MNMSSYHRLGLTLISQLVRTRDTFDYYNYMLYYAGTRYIFYTHNTLLYMNNTIIHRYNVYSYTIYLYTYNIQVYIYYIILYYNMAVITATFVFIFFPRQHLTSTLLHSVIFIIRFSTSQRIFGRGRNTTLMTSKRCAETKIGKNSTLNYDQNLRGFTF